MMCHETFLVNKSCLKIVVPSYETFACEELQKRLRLAIITISKETELNSRPFQDDIANEIYDFKGVIYITYRDKEVGIKHKKFVAPDIHQVLGDDGRWLRDFLKKHRPRRYHFKLMILALYIAIKKPQLYIKTIN